MSLSTAKLTTRTQLLEWSIASGGKSRVLQRLQSSIFPPLSPTKHYSILYRHRLLDWKRYSESMVNTLTSRTERQFYSHQVAHEISVHNLHSQAANDDFVIDRNSDNRITSIAPAKRSVAFHHTAFLDALAHEIDNDYPHLESLDKLAYTILSQAKGLLGKLDGHAVTLETLHQHVDPQEATLLRIFRAVIVSSSAMKGSIDLDSDVPQFLMGLWESRADYSPLYQSLVESWKYKVLDTLFHYKELSTIHSLLFEDPSVNPTSEIYKARYYWTLGEYDVIDGHVSQLILDPATHREALHVIRHVCNHYASKLHTPVTSFRFFIDNTKRLYGDVEFRAETARPFMLWTLYKMLDSVSFDPKFLVRLQPHYDNETYWQFLSTCMLVGKTFNKPELVEAVWDMKPFAALTSTDLSCHLHGLVALAEFAEAIDTYNAYSHLHEPDQIAVMLRIYAKNHDWDRMQLLFEQVIAKGPGFVQPIHYSIVMKGLASAGYDSVVSQLYTTYIRDGFAPNAEIVISMMMSKLQSRKFYEVFEQFSQTEKFGIQPTTYMYTLIFRTFKHQNDLESALMLWENMVANSKHLLSVEHAGLLIDMCSSAAKWEQATGVFNQLKEIGDCDGLLYKRMMQLYTKCHKHQLCLKLFDEIVIQNQSGGKRIPLAMDLYTEKLRCLVQLKDRLQASALFEEMKHFTHPVTLEFFEVAIHYMFLIGNIEGAVRIVSHDMMKHKNLTPTISHYNALLKGLSKDRPLSCIKLFDELSYKQNIYADYQSHLYLIDAFESLAQTSLKAQCTALVARAQQHLEQINDQVIDKLTKISNQQGDYYEAQFELKVHNRRTPSPDQLLVLLHKTVRFLQGVAHPWQVQGWLNHFVETKLVYIDATASFYGSLISKQIRIEINAKMGRWWNVDTFYEEYLQLVMEQSHVKPETPVVGKLYRSLLNPVVKYRFASLDKKKHTAGENVPGAVDELKRVTRLGFTLSNSVWNWLIPLIMKDPQNCLKGLELTENIFQNRGNSTSVSVKLLSLYKDTWYEIEEYLKNFVQLYVEHQVKHEMSVIKHSAVGSSSVSVLGEIQKLQFAIKYRELMSRILGRYPKATTRFVVANEYDAATNGFGTPSAGHKPLDFDVAGFQRDVERLLGELKRHIEL
ncbi:hypothetical protein BABINDRAFT_131873 [Babjeviella inositovora NRRL Y-12698]|uniref:Pentacotripeptide-repeat region of PRORP domain-containing protein n=1 Tax=Babjeviella inositovora NRRL Y-12698 TaxID=984486 RepID=A0A1E3QTR1_9ASCO|nr:uncharacterized protein BABINDRAFT_131873 [Babjeviella inositovora NRRL Y-12698]ODQ80327.1 hypothetical protein BABINDRAFT_131873 [Babjeviella inositovora NRRL Y-12698]